MTLCTRQSAPAAIEECPLRLAAGVITGHGNPSVDNCLVSGNPQGGDAFVGAAPVQTAPRWQQKTTLRDQKPVKAKRVHVHFVFDFKLTQLGEGAGGRGRGAIANALESVQQIS